MDQTVETERLLKESLEGNDVAALVVYQKVYQALSENPELQREYELVERKIWLRNMTYFRMELQSKAKQLEAMEKRLSELGNRHTALQNENKRIGNENSRYQTINTKLLEELRLETLCIKK